MTIHIHIGGEPDSVADAVALGSTAGAAELGGADEVTDGTAGLEVTAAEELVISAGEELVLSAGEELAVWLAVRLAIALPMLLPMLELHAVAMPAAHKSVAARSRFPVSRRIDGPFPHL
jgi:predicted metal-binding membrane protein